MREIRRPVSKSPIANQNFWDSIAVEIAENWNRMLALDGGELAKVSTELENVSDEITICLSGLFISISV
jgi:hypothetical protein